MEQLRAFNISATSEGLRNALLSGEADEQLRGAVDAVGAELTTRARANPLSIYLCSPDRDADLRNRFGFVLAQAVLERLPKTLLVDCDFLSSGLSGLVPKTNALGFLDLLLYGSSLAMVTQEAANGVHVIGAGSFPASKKSPFAMEAFVEAARYLGNQAKCVIFCGPALDKNDGAHPIVAHVDLPILVQSGDLKHHSDLEPLEEKIAAVKDSAVWSLRFTGADDGEAAVGATAPPGDVAESSDDTGVDEILGEAVPVLEPGDYKVVDEIEEGATSEPAQVLDIPYEEEGPITPPGEKSANSVFPRVITSVLGVFLVGFLLWWLYLTKSIRDDLQEPVSVALPTEQQKDERTPDVELSLMPDDAATMRPDSVIIETGQIPPPVGEDEGKIKAESTETVGPASPPAGEGPTAALDDYVGKYLVHVSSFRRIELAQSDANYLIGRGYDALVAPVDLGSKGLWYRVYVGPFDTQSEAKTAKIRLDENPRVRSTRITRVPG